MEFEDTQAMGEGWLITDDAEPQLQKLDESTVFRDDVEAWLHVYAQAQAGSAYHQQALAFLADRNPREHAEVMRRGDAHRASISTTGPA